MLLIWVRCRSSLSSSELSPPRHYHEFTYAVNGLVIKSALNKGLNHYTFAVYRNATAAVVFSLFALPFERNVRPRMTVQMFFQIMLLGLLEPVIDQNLFYTGMKYTTATFATAMANMLPAITFLMAWIFRLEKMKIKKIHSQGKILGIIVTVGGAMIMTLIQGPKIWLPWMSKENNLQHVSASDGTPKDRIKGSLMIAAGCFCWASFVILQAITLKAYPADLSLTSLICLFGSLQGAILTLLVERGNTSIWSIQWDNKLFAVLYSGIVCSGVSYYLSGMVMKARGPVFVTAFNPLGMVIIAVLGSLFLAEQMDLGRVLGALVIVVGLYLVIWGKRKDQMLSTSEKDQTAVDQQLTDITTTTSENDQIAIDHRQMTQQLQKNC